MQDLVTPFQRRLNDLPTDIREALGLDPYVGRERRSRGAPMPVQRTRRDWFARPVGKLAGSPSGRVGGWE